MTDLNRKPTEDDALVAELLAGPTLEEAQSSLDYRRRRRRSLPFYRRAARREADAMISSWAKSARAGRRRRFGPSLVERLAEALGFNPPVAPGLVGRVVRRAMLRAVALLIVFVVIAVVLWSELEPIIRLFIQVGGE